MFTVALIALATVAVVGLGAKGLCAIIDRRTSPSISRRISWSEYGIAMIPMAALVIPVVMWIGNSMSINSQLTDQQWLNGVELKPTSSVTQCYAGNPSSNASENDATSGDSNCSYSYDTGNRYEYEVARQVTSCTGSGTNKTCTTTTVYDDYWADIYAPYATEEYSYAVSNSLGGNYDYPGYYLAANPVPYVHGHAIPADIPRGAPPDWQDALAHYNTGNPRPVTEIGTYENPILATNDQEYLQYSGDIKAYLHDGLLPPAAANITANPIYQNGARSLSDKVSFVKVTLPNEASWQAADMQFNGGFGMKLQGDLHVVIVDGSRISNPQDYINALKAYWQSAQYFGKRALAKNAVIVVIGTSDSKTVSWALATTGMPYGNGPMLQAIANDLPGTALTPAAVFGDPHTVVTPASKPGAKATTTVTLSNPPGVLSEVMFSTFPFQRACMINCPNGQVGYSYLIAKIHPSGEADFVMIIIIDGVSLAFWLYVGRSDRFDFGRKRRNQRNTDIPWDRVPS